MTNREAISKLVAAGLVKFPEPETRSVQAIKHSNNRRHSPPAPSAKPEPPVTNFAQGGGRTFPQDVMAIADAAKREKYRVPLRVPLRGPNFKERRYVIHSKDLKLGEPQ